MRFENKVVIVTGGARGIGEAIIRQFSENGATVVISDLLEEDGTALAAELNGSSHPACFIRTDASDPDSVSACIDEAEKQGSRYGYRKEGQGAR